MKHPYDLALIEDEPQEVECGGCEQPYRVTLHVRHIFECEAVAKTKAAP